MANAIVKGFKWLANATGALVGYISGDGSEVQFFSSGLFAARPAASVYNVGAMYWATDVNGGTGYTNFNGISWTKTHVGTNFETNAAVYLRDTLANILATTPSYIGQSAFCTDHGITPGLELVALTTSAWGLPPRWQTIGAQNTDVSAGADTSEDTLYTYPGTGGLPILRANDAIRVLQGWTQSVANTNARTCKTKFGTTNVVSQNIASTTKAGWIHQYDMRNKALVTSQAGGATNFDVFGQLSNAAATHALDFSAQMAFKITGTKANSGDTLTLNYVELAVRGGG